eukprot:evm.model.scf_539.7 EVM.evm.TU.scf_539.7   scf_539:74997-75530(+)
MVSSSFSGSGGAIGAGYYREPAEEVGSWYCGKDETVGFYDKEEKKGGAAEAAAKPAPQKCYLESPLSSDQEDVGESEDCSELTVVPDDSSYSGHDAVEGPCAKDALVPKDSFIAKKISHDRKDSDYLINGWLSV